MRTKFFTRTGDSGKSILGNKSFSKDDPFFEFLGTLDELNSWLGFCGVGLRRGSGRGVVNAGVILLRLQEILFIAQAEIAGIFFGSKRYPKLSKKEVLYLENVIQEIDGLLPELKKFIIPGGAELSAKLEVARALTRRAERLAVAFSKQKKISPELLSFLNRLASLFFALARYENFRQKIKEKNPTYS